jgi:hypothetical protein
MPRWVTYSKPSGFAVCATVGRLGGHQAEHRGGKKGSFFGALGKNSHYGSNNVVIFILYLQTIQCRILF